MSRDINDYGKGYTLVEDKEVDDNLILPDDQWALKIDGAIVGINYIKFGEEENEDGTRDLEIDFDVLEGEPPEGIDDIVGNAIIKILEDAYLAKDYKEIVKEAENLKDTMKKVHESRE